MSGYQNRVQKVASLSEEEKKQLSLLLQKAKGGYSSAVAGSSSGACPTEGKRSADEAEISEILKDEGLGEWIMGEDLPPVEGEEGIETIDGPIAVTTLYRDPSIYLPEGIRSFEEWSQVILKFKSIASHVWTYEEWTRMTLTGNYNQDVKDQIRFGRTLVSKYAKEPKRMCAWVAKHQAEDFAHYLLAYGWEKQVQWMESTRAKPSKTAFKREFKGCRP